MVLGGVDHTHNVKLYDFFVDQQAVLPRAVLHERYYALANVNNKLSGNFDNDKNTKCQVYTTVASRREKILPLK